ncbi:hypothetical protein JTE90_009945 [Oedothorax gibbosus]|uniref:HMG box domain-containing protein n=1 Tax=Oedothorax gibbosus TaxID=931172 RepID=A0AAV6UI19_9ARAC|nr:hypothetical protein JTE90_009945 [Oedothorax gibbosus]
MIPNTQSNKSADNFDLNLSMGQESGEGSYMDHTFHTPSFGDEEFDIPPIHLPPSTPTSSDTNSSDVYGATQPLSHQDQQPTQQNQTPNTTNNNQQQQQQQHMMSPPPHQMSPSPCSQSGLDRLGPVMTAVTTPTPSPPAMMTSSSFVGSPQQHMQHQQHLQQHMQQQQQQYPQQHQNDMYMLQIAPQGAMMPPQPMHFHVQQYAVPTGYMQQQQHQHFQQQQHMHHPQQLLPPSPMLQLQLTRGGRPPSSSPPGSTHTSPGLALETSEDSDDSAHLAQLMCNGALKRPSPEPCERPSSAGGKPPKKPKVQKKKKKRDPNEPQKPVSAYALFFRDTQAAIKGQNPNASFGEVSKIVASMWDSLDIDHKNVYKKKTEAAKKEYLKALAAYRASLVSKAANDQPPDSGYSGGGSMGGGGLSPLQKKSPLLTSLMEGAPPSAMQQQNMANQQQSMIMAQNQMGHHPQQHMGQHPTHQMLHQMLSPPNGAQQQQQQMLHPHMMQQQQQHHAMQHQMNNNNLTYAQNMQQPGQQGQHLNHGQVQQQPGMMQQQQPCSRNDPSNNQQQEWDNREFCNNDCVVSHCRDVFTTWVAARPPQTSYASVK